MIDLAVAIEQDFGVVSGSHVCAKEAQLSGGWSCFRPRGDQYHGTATDKKLPTVVAIGTTRLVAAADYDFDGFTLGARVGWAFRGLGPTSDAETPVIPVDVAARARLVLLRSPVRVDLLAVFGMRQVDLRVKQSIIEDRSVPPSAYQLDNPDQQTLMAFKRLGFGFVGVGPSVSYPLGPRSALRFELPLSLSFPSTGFAFSPSLAWVVTP